MTVIDSFGGTLWVRPGHARPDNLRNTRPDWVGRLTRGLPAGRLAATLGSLFSLCGHAHIACADLAVEAALGRSEPVSVEARAWLAQQTLREHLRRLWLDWPRRLPETPASDASLDAAARELASSPAFASMPGEADAWLEAHAIRMPLAEWVTAWESDPAVWLTEWCERTDSLPARLLRACRPAASAMLPGVAPLRVHADAEGLRAWTACLADGAAAARRPHWQGDCAETGVWTRLNDITAQPLDTPWLKLGARLAESVRLALPEAAQSAHTQPACAWLSLGALPLARGEAVAWVEMARGLLIHHVRLDGEGDAARVRACQVIAPTEWNFHPDGALARALEAWPPAHTDEARRRLDVLMAAYDPCVPFKQEQSMPVEVAHA